MLPWPLDGRHGASSGAVYLEVRAGIDRVDVCHFGLLRLGGVLFDGDKRHVLMVRLESGEGLRRANVLPMRVKVLSGKIVVFRIRFILFMIEHALNEIANLAPNNCKKKVSKEHRGQL